MPTQKHTSDNLLMPIPTPDTVETVAMAVIHQMLTTYKYIRHNCYLMRNHVEERSFPSKDKNTMLPES